MRALAFLLLLGSLSCPRASSYLRGACLQCHTLLYYSYRCPGDTPHTPPISPRHSQQASASSDSNCRPYRQSQKCSFPQPQERKGLSALSHPKCALREERPADWVLLTLTIPGPRRLPSSKKRERKRLLDLLSHVNLYSQTAVQPPQ